MNKPHKHAALIKAWADRADVEYHCAVTNSWMPATSPLWDDNRFYRIKPERSYPKSTLDYSDLCNLRTLAHNEHTLSRAGEGFDTYLARIVADAAVKRYIKENE